MAERCGLGVYVKPEDLHVLERVFGPHETSQPPGASCNGRWEGYHWYFWSEVAWGGESDLIKLAREGLSFKAMHDAHYSEWNAMMMISLNGQLVTQECGYNGPPHVLVNPRDSLKVKAALEFLSMWEGDNATV